MDTVVRGLTEQDWPDALVLAEKVFGVGPWLFHSLHQGSSDRRFSDACGAWVDGELVSLVDVFFRQVRMPNGQSAKMGGIGTVCTLPQFRGQGLSGRLINRVDQVMVEQSADWSMLFTGVQGHYARFGWVEVPRYWFETESFTLPDSSESSFRIESKDWWKPGEAHLLAGLYDQSAEGIPVTCVRDEKLWNFATRERLNRPEARTFLAWDEENLAGYLVVKLGSGLDFVEAAGDSQVLKDLAHAACTWALDEGKTSLSLNLPSRRVAALPAWAREGAIGKSGNWTMVKAISDRWSQAELEQLFTSKQAHHFSLDDF